MGQRASCLPFLRRCQVLHYPNLDSRTRQSAVQEVDLDLANGEFYFGRRLSPTGTRDWPGLLKEALAHHNDAWLAAELSKNGRLVTTEWVSYRGRSIEKKVPWNANEMLAEGEFNRFYIRGLARCAEEDAIPGLVVYRAKAVRQPRPESEALIGSTLIPRELLADLRSSQGRDTILGMPG